jgi:hypothetical protein
VGLAAMFAFLYPTLPLLHYMAPWMYWLIDRLLSCVSAPQGLGLHGRMAFS